MTEKRSNQRQEIKRHSVSERYCSVRIVSCQDLNCVDQCVRIVDLSIIGIGIESDQPISQGILWFKETVYGQKWGRVVWQKKTGNRHRIGIEFISLSRPEEDYVRDRVEQGESGKVIQDPEAIISRLMRSARNEPEPAVNHV